jgi:hypothetical protein
MQSYTHILYLALSLGDSRNLCIAPELISNRCSANRTGRSRVISCHSRDIGIAMFTSCNHYKDDGPELCEVSWLR